MMIFNFFDKIYVFVFYQFICCLSLIIFGDPEDLLSSLTFASEKKENTHFINNYKSKILNPLNRIFFFTLTK